MKTIKYLLTAAGFILLLFGCCLTVPGDDKWYIPMLIELGGAMIIGAGVLINHLQRIRLSKSDKPVVKIQNSDYAGEFTKLWNEIILNEIWQ